MSHFIEEIPKTLPDKGIWLFVIAENWIKDEILYLPDESYSTAYKMNLLKGGTYPNIENRDSNPTFKIVGKFCI